MLKLLTTETPNGLKISVALEELGLDYEVRRIDLMKGEQKQPWFLQLNPNGRIPVLIDGDNDDLVLFESGAILMYLAEKTGRLLPKDAKRRWQAIEWLMFQMGGVGPMMGQANVFHRYAPVKLPWAIERYQRESRRLFEVLNQRLESAPFLAEEYSIADIANFTWVRSHDWSGVSIDGLPYLMRWLEEIAARPAVQRGLAIPAPPAESDDEQQRIQGIRTILA